MRNLSSHRRTASPHRGSLRYKAFLPLFSFLRALSLSFSVRRIRTRALSGKEKKIGADKKDESDVVDAGNSDRRVARTKVEGRRRIRVRANLCRRKSTVTLDWKLSRAEHVPVSIPDRSCQTINAEFIPHFKDTNSRGFYATKSTRVTERFHHAYMFAFQFTTNCFRLIV